MRLTTGGVRSLGLVCVDGVMVRASLALMVANAESGQSRYLESLDRTCCAR